MKVSYLERCARMRTYENKEDKNKRSDKLLRTQLEGLEENMEQQWDETGWWVEKNLGLWDIFLPQRRRYITKSMELQGYNWTLGCTDRGPPKHSAVQLLQLPVAFKSKMIWIWGVKTTNIMENECTQFTEAKWIALDKSWKHSECRCRSFLMLHLMKRRVHCTQRQEFFLSTSLIIKKKQTNKNTPKKKKVISLW